MMSREALEKVGLFDEEFWQCNEDTDWCYRARKAGFRVVYVDRAAILHKGGSSADLSNKKIFSYGYFIGRNAFTFARKHGNVFQKTKLFIMLWVGVLGRIAFFTLDNTKHAILGQRAFVRGMLDGMRGQLTPELITVSIQPRRRDFRQGIRGRLLRWLGV
jgi:GT2 family glycosyltransferase